MFRSRVILNDGDKFQGVQYRVCIGAHKKGANKCSCRSVINHNKYYREKHEPIVPVLVQGIHYYDV